VFSLGAIAHELMTGRRPAGPGEQPGAFAPGLDAGQRAGLRRAIADALAADPAERPSSCGALVEALRTAVDHGQPSLPMMVAPAPPAVPAAPGALDAALEHPAGLDAADADAAAQADAAVAPLSGPAPELDDDWTYKEPAPSGPAAPVAPPVPVPATSPPRSGAGWGRAAAMVVAGLALGLASVLMFRADRAAGDDRSDEAAATTATMATDTEVDLEVDPAVTPEPAEPAPSQDPPAGMAQGETLAGPEPPAAEAPVRPVGPPARRVSAPSGQLLVRSQPAGALVLIDGQLRGETPATVRDLALGRHAVRVARPGYAPVTRQVTLTPEAPSGNLLVELQAAFEPAVARVGAVYADSRPRGARVLLDGRFVGTTPMRLPEVAAGRHVVRLELEGYRSVTAPITVSGAREARVAVTLEPASGRPGGR
jgi:hypothetical protein